MNSPSARRFRHWSHAPSRRTMQRRQHARPRANAIPNLRAPKKRRRRRPSPAKRRQPMLERINMNRKLTEKQYEDQMGKLQVRLRELEFKAFRRKVPVLCVFEGWDAAGKGGAIKRVTEMLDPRGFTVNAYAAPKGEEKTHHYLW